MTSTQPPEAAPAGWLARASRIAPGLPSLLRYRPADFPHDLVAGLSVAAVALPVGVAYAQLTGFGPEVGLYSSILPLVAYALFGTSRQLIIGPDAATCALVAAAVAPLAAGDADVYASLSLTLAFIAGLLCVAGSFLKLGALADFLSRPILVGFMNGIALSIVLGQIGKVLGFSVEAGGIVPRLLEVISKLGLTHWPTLAIGAGSFALLWLAPRLVPRLPAALVTMIAAALVVAVLGLDSNGVKIIGEVPAGLPQLRIPAFSTELVPTLLSSAAGIALIAFASMVVTARSFAIKNGYEIDVDHRFRAVAGLRREWSRFAYRDERCRRRAHTRRRARCGSGDLRRAAVLHRAAALRAHRGAGCGARNRRTFPGGPRRAAHVAQDRPARGCPVGPGYAGRGCLRCRAGHPAGRDAGACALRAPGVPADGRDVGPGARVPRLPLSAAPCGCRHRGRARAAALQRTDRVLQRTAIQARSGGGRRPGDALAGPRHAAGHDGRRHRAADRNRVSRSAARAGRDARARGPRYAVAALGALARVLARSPHLSLARGGRTRVHAAEAAASPSTPQPRSVG